MSTEQKYHPLRVYYILRRYNYPQNYEKNTRTSHRYVREIESLAKARVCKLRGV